VTAVEFSVGAQPKECFFIIIIIIIYKDSEKFEGTPNELIKYNLLLLLRLLFVYTHICDINLFKCAYIYVCAKRLYIRIYIYFVCV